jgi:hypothetical protein
VKSSPTHICKKGAPKKSSLTRAPGGLNGPFVLLPLTVTFAVIEELDVTHSCTDTTKRPDVVPYSVKRRRVMSSTCGQQSHILERSILGGWRTRTATRASPPPLDDAQTSIAVGLDWDLIATSVGQGFEF